MPYRDPEKRRAYNREYGRRRRAGVPTRSAVKPFCQTSNPELTQTARGLLGVLSSLLKDVLAAEGDIFMKARAAGYLISIGLKAIEVADLEARLEALEQYLGGNTNED